MLESAIDDARVVVTAFEGAFDADEDVESLSPREDVEVEVDSFFSGADDDETAVDEDEGMVVSALAGVSNNVVLGPASAVSLLVTTSEDETAVVDPAAVVVSSVDVGVASVAADVGVASVAAEVFVASMDVVA